MRALVLLFAVLVVSCGRDKIVPPPDTSGKHQRVDVMLLVAPWCHACREEMSESSRLYKAINKERVLVAAFLETNYFNSKASEEDAKEMKETSSVEYDVLPDEKAWGLAKQYAPGLPGILPLAVVTANDVTCENDQCKVDNSLIKVFAPPYKIGDVFEFASRQLDPNWKPKEEKTWKQK